MTDFLRALLRHGGGTVWVSLGLMLLLGLFRGIGLAMILPFLHVIGMTPQGGGSRYAEMFADAMAHLGIPADFSSVILVYLLLILIHALVARYQAVLATRITAGFAHHLRDVIYDRFCRTEWHRFLGIPNPEIIQVLTLDINQVAFGTQMMIKATASAILLLIYISFSFTLSIPMTLAALGCGGIFMLIMRPLNRRAVGVGTAQWQARKQMVTTISEHIGGMKVVKSYNLEGELKKTFSNASEATTREMVSFQRLNATTRAAYQVGAALVIAACLSIGVVALSLPAVDLMVIIFLFSRILPGVSEIQQAFQRFANALPAFESVQSMAEKLKPGEVTRSVNSVAAFTLGEELRFDRVWFRYQRSWENWSLGDLSLVFPARRISAVVGPSGAGKTSVADLVLGVLEPERGTILADGQPISAHGMAVWRNRVAYVPQEVFLFSGTIRSNLEAVRPGAGEARMWEALKKASAKTFVSELEQGLDTRVGDNGLRLSGGERQRIALARALMRDPFLLVLDEATSSLDRENEELILAALDRLKSEMTIVVIAHRLSSIENADHVVHLDGGRVVRRKSIPQQIA